MEPPLAWPRNGMPHGSEKDARGSFENCTGAVSPANLALQVSVRVVSTTTPSGIDDSGCGCVASTVMSATTMSISPSVSPTSWENETVKAGGAEKRTASGIPSSLVSVRSRLAHDSG